MKIRMSSLSTLLGVKIVKLLVKTQWLKEESGQDLIEYALVVALVAFAATAGMSSLAAGINQAFSNIATTLSSYIT
jgi:pilus assembly protein Flp/PilA